MTDRLARALRVLLLALVLAPAVQAAVPHDGAVPAYAEEQTILQQEKDAPEPGWGSAASGRRHFERNYLGQIGRDTEQDLILQRGGNTWRTIRNGPLATISATILVLTLLGVLAAWRFLGSNRPHEPETGRRILRFTGWQRLVHWVTAISFIVLALTGLIILFGKQLLIPLIGHAAFSWLAIVSKYLHNVSGPLFLLFTLVMFFTFLRHNFFVRRDWEWIRSGGGMLSGRHVPAPYFNAGEKTWFWLGVVLLGLLMSLTGLLLDFPSLTTRYTLQWANYLHLGGATLYMAMSLGHIYMGTVGTPGAYHAMRHGTVDESWARQHHEDWYRELQDQGALDDPGYGRTGGAAGRRPGTGLHQEGA